VGSWATVRPFSDWTPPSCQCLGPQSRSQFYPPHKELPVFPSSSLDAKEWECPRGAMGPGVLPTTLLAQTQVKVWGQLYAHMNNKRKKKKVWGQVHGPGRTCQAPRSPVSEPAHQHWLEPEPGNFPFLSLPSAFLPGCHCWL
jgi:hypothetical protein